MTTIALPPALRKLPIGRSLPIDVGALHFVGIGGIGMSGIAEILHNLGYTVQGSDMTESGNLERLRKLGMRVTVGHKPENLRDQEGREVAVVVISSAVKADNPEVVEAHAQRIPVVRRAEMLAELMRLKMSVAVAGTHGKTTTTSLIAALLDAGGKHPTVVNGGIINAYGTNARLGAGEWMVVEADESDGTFIKLPSTIAVITNIDPEHLEYYGGFDALRGAFATFLDNLPFYGFGVLCIDHPEVQALLARVTDRRLISYGTSALAAVRGVNAQHTPGGQRFDVEFSERAGLPAHTLKDIFLPMHGMHNLRNALAAIAVAEELKIPEDHIRGALALFTGVKRRFTKTGEVGGISIIDDYGHHPVEIAATLKAARESLGTAEGGEGGKVIAVVQPHRYTRVRDLFEGFCTCFNDADHVVVADVYAAGETAIEGYSRDTLIEQLRRCGHRNVTALEKPEDLAGVIAGIAQPGDLVVCLGAGSITYWANALPEQLEAVLAKKNKKKA